MRYLKSFHVSLQNAVDFYALENRAVARRFIAAIEDAERKIARFPRIGRLMGEFRGVHLQEFPYRYCYKEDVDGDLVAVVLFHYKQRRPILT